MVSWAVLQLSNIHSLFHAVYKKKSLCKIRVHCHVKRIILFFRPTIEAKEFLVENNTVWVNTTTRWRVSLDIFAVDNGNPRRGDYFRIFVSYDPSCDSTGKVTVNESTGYVHFIAPNMTIYSKEKKRYGGV